MTAAKLRALAACLLACLCGLAATSTAAGPARVVILPVVVHSALPDSTYVSRGLSDMLSARLEQLGGVEVVQPPDPAGATTRLEEAIEAARTAGGDYVLFGAFTQFGDGASLDVQCAPVGGSSTARSIFIQSGTIGEIIPKLDELADKVARYVRGEQPAEAPRAVSADSNGDSGSPAGGDAQLYEDLRRRLDALERAVFSPMVGATEAQEPPAQPAQGLPDAGEGEDRPES